ncbi:MAG: amidohydrolase [Candidatus Meridianibacter frigidus]|nr:MAG: amidohydrolase [Candidatus Eremiobacteraeota bacterium]
MPLIIAQETIERVCDLRRQIHRFPELGFDVHRTAALVESELSALGIEYRRVTPTGVVGVVRGARGGPVVGLRADMDALPIPEQSGEPFSSEHANAMHACGHDAHAAMLLGAARTLQQNRKELSGTVVCIFQPAEEGPDPGGALPMIEAGVMDDPKIAAMAMLHVDTRLETGTIGITPGPVSAAADEFYISVHGRGGHGAYPHTANDAIPAAAAMVLGLQNIAARETDPLASVVVTVGTIAGGYRNNVISDKVEMSGTFRAHDPAVRGQLGQRARRVIEGIAAAYNVQATLRVVSGYPAVVNDDKLAADFAAYMATRENTRVERAAPTMGAEDFAYFAQLVPSVLVRLGIRNEGKGITAPGHSAQFRLDEDALPVGVRTLVAFANVVTSGAIRLGAERHAAGD